MAMEKQKPRLKSDFELLREHHRLIHEAPSEGEPVTWEEKLARDYDAKLSKEFAICDLSQSNRGKLGLRWRTEREVVIGKGETSCAERKCSSRLGIAPYEVLFDYKEQGEHKQILVKVVLCTSCAEKLAHYYAIRRALKTERTISRPAKQGQQHASPSSRRHGGRSRSRS